MKKNGKSPDVGGHISWAVPSPFHPSPVQSSSSSLGGWSEDSSSCRNSSTSTDSGRGSDMSMRTATIHGCYNRFSYLPSPQPFSSFSPSHSSPSSATAAGGAVTSWSSPAAAKQSEQAVVRTRKENDFHCPNNIESTRKESEDNSILSHWLSSLQFECYHPLFISSGYDLPTISRMTPEDLTAIGIQHPGHRKKLKLAISQLNIPDGLPDYIPASLAEWLRLIRLEDYGPGLAAQGYTTVQGVTTISIEDLEDIGFYILGHQKRLLLAIRKIKEVSQADSRKTAENSSNQYQTQEIMLPAVQHVHTKQDAFSSFHHQVSAQDQAILQSPLQSYKLPTHYPLPNSAYSTYSQHEDLPHPKAELMPPVYDQPPAVHSQQEDLPHPMPEPMQPLSYPLFTLNRTPEENFSPRHAGLTNIPQIKPYTAMFHSQDENLRLRKPSIEDSILQDSILQHNYKKRPVAKVAANARKSLNFSQSSSAAPGCKISQERTHMSHNYSKIADLGTISTINQPFARRKSINSFPVTEHTYEASGKNNTETQILMSKSSNPTISRRKTMGDRSLSLPMNTAEPDCPDSQESSQNLLPDPDQARCRSAGDVLQDIGSMLSDLTDELDAMLRMEEDEQDK